MVEQILVEENANEEETKSLPQRRHPSDDDDVVGEVCDAAFFRGKALLFGETRRRRFNFKVKREKRSLAPDDDDKDNNDDNNNGNVADTSSKEETGLFNDIFLHV